MTSAVSVADKDCLLCNEVISTKAYDDVKKEGLNKLKELSEQSLKGEEIFCCNNPYKEIWYAHFPIEGTIINIPVSLLNIFPTRFCLK